MNPVSKDIADLLTAESAFALTQADNLFIARMPPEPDSCIVIYDLQGGPPLLRLQKDTSNLYTVEFMIQVRDNDYDEAYAKLRAYSEFMHGMGNFTYGDQTHYLVIKALGEPQLLVWDDKDRSIMFVNFQCVRRPSVEGLDYEFTAFGALLHSTSSGDNDDWSIDNLNTIIKNGLIANDVNLYWDYALLSGGDNKHIFYIIPQYNSNGGSTSDFRIQAINDAGSVISNSWYEFRVASNGTFTINWMVGKSSFQGGPFPANTQVELHISLEAGTTIFYWIEPVSETNSLGSERFWSGAGRFLLTSIGQAYRVRTVDYKIGGVSI